MSAHVTWELRWYHGSSSLYDEGPFCIFLYTFFKIVIGKERSQLKKERMERRIIKSEYQDVRLNSTLLEHPDSRGLCVIFPGKRYTVNKPLLYYPLRLAMAKGYNLLILSYGKFPLNERTSYTMKHLIKGVIEQVLAEDSQRKDLIFISKSVGALFAAETAVAMGEGYSPRCIYLTPLNQMVEAMAKTDFMAVSGSEDRLLDHNRAFKLLGDKEDRLKIVHGADHSLNAPIVYDSLRILEEVLDDIDRFIE